MWRAPRASIAESLLFHFLFRIIGLFVLALALVMAILDITRSITASALVLTPLSQSWQSITPQTLLALQAWVENWTVSFLWDPIIISVLHLPSWLVFAAFALLLLWMGRKRENLYGRFASR